MAAKIQIPRHRDPRRKNANASPYINHPIAVAQVLADDCGGRDSRRP